MQIRFRSHLVSNRAALILLVLGRMVVGPSMSAQSYTYLAISYALPCSRNMSTETSNQKETAPAVDSKVMKKRLRVTVINMSSSSRQAVLRDGKINLPVGECVALEIAAGGTLRVVSDTDPRLDERFVISERETARVLIVQ